MQVLCARAELGLRWHVRRVHLVIKLDPLRSVLSPGTKISSMEVGMAIRRAKATQQMEGPSLLKAGTGIHGLDEITGGGLPRGRPTLVCGAAGCGKTMLAAEFLVCGATRFDEPGVFMMFEESAAELTEQRAVAGLRPRQAAKAAQDRARLCSHRAQRDRGDRRIRPGRPVHPPGHAINRIGAKRVVLDTIEALFAGLPNQAVLRAELRRLFRWLKDRGLTAVITGERGEDSLTRYGLEEYVADCVILLDHRINDQVSTRRLRVVKYRGSAHGTNEYPFLIGPRGLSVLPITSLRLDHKASAQRVSTGIAGLDEMLGGKGVYRGSSVLVSGSPGTGKSSIGGELLPTPRARAANVLCCSPMRNPKASCCATCARSGSTCSSGLTKGLLQIHASRPTLHGLEQHLVSMYETGARVQARGGGGRPDQQPDDGARRRWP